jgi:hypothetical protein
MSLSAWQVGCSRKWTSVASDGDEELPRLRRDRISPRRRRGDGKMTGGRIESYRVDQNHPQPVAKARRRKSLKANLGRISPRHIRVILEYAPGKDLAEIAGEEKSNRGTILRILRTAPFTPLNVPESSVQRRPARTETTVASASRKTVVAQAMNIPEWMGYIN